MGKTFYFGDLWRPFLVNQPKWKLPSPAILFKIYQVELHYLVLMYQKKVIKRFNAETTLADLLACKKKDLGPCLDHGKKVRSKF